VTRRSSNKRVATVKITEYESERPRTVAIFDAATPRPRTRVIHSAPGVVTKT